MITPISQSEQGFPDGCADWTDLTNHSRLTSGSNGHLSPTTKPPRTVEARRPPETEADAGPYDHYTRRQVKRADKARKLAALPMRKRVVPFIVVVGLFLIVVVSCGANAAADRAEVARCTAVHEQALADAGSERALTPEEVAVCNAPERRAFILGDD